MNSTAYVLGKKHGNTSEASNILTKREEGFTIYMNNFEPKIPLSEKEGTDPKFRYSDFRLGIADGLSESGSLPEIPITPEMKEILNDAKTVLKPVTYIS